MLTKSEIEYLKKYKENFKSLKKCYIAHNYLNI